METYQFTKWPIYQAEYVPSHHLSLVYQNMGAKVWRNQGSLEHGVMCWRGRKSRRAGGDTIALIRVLKLRIRGVDWRAIFCDSRRIEKDKGSRTRLKWVSNQMIGQIQCEGAGRWTVMIGSKCRWANLDQAELVGAGDAFFMAAWLRFASSWSRSWVFP